MDWKKVKPETIIRTCCLILAMINAGLEIFGKSPIPISNDAVRDVITYAFALGSAMWAWWKNNSFTTHAIEADEYLKELKNGLPEVKEDED